MASARLQYLLQKCLAQQDTEEERAELHALLQETAHASQVNDLFAAAIDEQSKQQVVTDDTRNAILSNIFLAAQHTAETHAPATIRRMYPLRKWASVAAAVLLLGTGIYFWRTRKNQSAEHAILAQTDIAPGGNKAMLTLANGSTIALDSAMNGTLAQQGNMQIVKLANGQIAYNGPTTSGDAEMTNTMSTPNGGQYQLTLPEGTKVWLNAASSITYPATFTGNERKVKISGEVYFEVAQQSAHPFIVDVNGQSQIEVLGTHFNVNSYANEGAIKTSLLEGKVRVNTVATSSPQSLILVPGQQAKIQLSKGAIQLIEHADMNQVMSWKNGFFNLQDASLEAVMRQLERWYNVDVKYEGKIPEITFKGRLDRRVNLSDVLRYFADLGINVKREGRTLTVINN